MLAVTTVRLDEHEKSEGKITDQLRKDLALAATTVNLNEHKEAGEKVTGQLREDLSVVIDRVQIVEREASAAEEATVGLDSRVEHLAGTMATRDMLEERTRVLGAQLETVKVELKGDIRTLASRLETALEAILRIEAHQRNGK